MCMHGKVSMCMGDGNAGDRVKHVYNMHVVQV